MTIITPDRDEFLRTVGEAVEAYARVEASLARLLSTILEIDAWEAEVVFYTIQNVKSRNEMFRNLMANKFNARYDAYWKSAANYLNILSAFRNALVHWHPQPNAVVGGISYIESAIRNPMPGKTVKLNRKSIAPFLDDCSYIRGEIDHLAGAIRAAYSGKTDEASLEKFSQTLTRRNQSVLEPPPMRKAPEPPPASSRRPPQSD